MKSFTSRKLDAFISAFSLLVVLAMTDCTSVSVRSVATGHDIKSVVIIDSPKVLVANFTDVLIDGFARHGIRAKVIPATVKPSGEYVVAYVAFRQWDMAPYLCDATIGIEKNWEIIATASYHLRGGGGLSLAKWNGTRSKIGPVMDELPKNV